MTDKELLVAARKLIERPEDWANFAASDHLSVGSLRTIFRLQCDAGDTASYILAIKRLARATQDSTNIADDDLTYACSLIAGWENDSHTHAEVLAAFDRAIAATEH